MQVSSIKVESFNTNQCCMIAFALNKKQQHTSEDKE